MVGVDRYVLDGVDRQECDGVGGRCGQLGVWWWWCLGRR